MRFDLLIKGGRVVDPDNGRDEVCDVAVRFGRIAAVDSNIPADSAAVTRDASGLLVLPGLVDLHTHIYRGSTFWGVDPDPIASRTGVTTWVDAGSAGAFTVDGFREFVARPAKVTIRAFLNISCIGLAAHDYELTNLAFCDPKLFEIVVNANRDLIIGGKVRLGTSTVGTNGFEPLRLARRVLERCDLPVMLHIAQRPPEPEHFEDLLRAGDVVTHCYTPQSMKLVDDDGEVMEFAKRWADRGVLFDIGHGTGSFSFKSAAALLAAGITPDFISSDIHQNSVRGPMYDLPTCMSKLLGLGMEMTDVVAAATAKPARFLGMEREVGTLAEGSRADIALFRVTREASTVYDATWHARRVNERLQHVVTFLAGRALEEVADPPAPAFLEWRRGGRDDALYAQQAAARAGGAVETIAASAFGTTPSRA